MADSITMKAPLTELQLQELRQDYGNIENIDPKSPHWRLLNRFIEGQPPAALRQLADGGIRWLSYLAKRALPKEPSLVPACGGTEVPTTINGRKYLYCWDKNMTGTFPGDHVYVDLGTDTPISPEEHRRIFG
jgi:hypothetical protein